MPKRHLLRPRGGLIDSLSLKVLDHCHLLSSGPRIEHESITFSRIQLVVAENKGYSLAQQRRFEEGYLAMNSIPSNVPQGVETLSAKITRAKILLLEVYQLLESDPLLCVLSESGTLSIRLR